VSLFQYEKGLDENEIRQHPVFYLFQEIADNGLFVSIDLDALQIHKDLLPEDFIDYSNNKGQLQFDTIEEVFEKVRDLYETLYNNTRLVQYKHNFDYMECVCKRMQSFIMGENSDLADLLDKTNVSELVTASADDAEMNSIN
jgi:hypothetical protein